MKKDEIFFAESGLTTTSANHIANIAKEMYSNLESELQQVSFYDESVKLLSGGSDAYLNKGITSDALKDIPASLKCIADLKSLIAWLREAIKAKERLIKEASSKDFAELAAELGVEIPQRPSDYPRLTLEDIVGEWNIKQRNRYYYLDTLCSTIGQYIHPDRVYSREKKILEKIIRKPYTTEGSGRDCVITTRTPSVSIDEVNSVFFDLQNTYRGYQAELNSMKHEIETLMQKDDAEKSAKETEEYQAYKTSYDVVVSRLTAYRKELVIGAQNLKIQIPDSLKTIYYAVANAGKSKQ